MIAGQRLARLELDLETATVLAAIPIAREEEGVRNLAAETTRDVNEARQANDRWTRQRQLLRANDTIRISFDNFCFAIDDESQGATQWYHRQRLERSIQCQTTNDQALLLGKPTQIYNWYYTNRLRLALYTDDSQTASVTAGLRLPTAKCRLLAGGWRLSACCRRLNLNSEQAASGRPKAASRRHGFSPPV